MRFSPPTGPDEGVVGHNEGGGGDAPGPGVGGQLSVSGGEGGGREGGGRGDGPSLDGAHH